MSKNHMGESQEQELARLRQENAILVQGRNAALRVAISDKGAVSLYGMGRFPVTLYAEQWDRLIAYVPQIKAFVEENRGSLKTKAQSILEKATEKSLQAETDRLNRVAQFQGKQA